MILFWFKMSITPTEGSLSRAMSELSIAANSDFEELSAEKTLETVNKVVVTDARIQGIFGSRDIQGKMRSCRAFLSGNFIGQEVQEISGGRHSKVIEISSPARLLAAKIPKDLKGAEYIRQEIKILEHLNAKEKEKGQEHFIQLSAVIMTTDTQVPVMLIPLYVKNLGKHIMSTQNGLSLAEIGKLIRQMFEALAFLKEERIVHRDIKIENILQSEDGTFKLADFGFAKRLGNLEEGMEGRLLGTAMYFSPELLQVGPYEIAPYSFASDMWAMACTLFSSFSRQPLFGIKPTDEGWVRELKLQQQKLKSPTPNGLKARMVRICSKKEIPEGNSAEFEILLTKMLILDPMERLTSEQGLETFSS